MNHRQSDNGPPKSTNGRSGRVGRPPKSACNGCCDPPPSKVSNGKSSTKSEALKRAQPAREKILKESWSDSDADEYIPSTRSVRRKLTLSPPSRSPSLSDSPPSGSGGGKAPRMSASGKRIGRPPKKGTHVAASPLSSSHLASSAAGGSSSSLSNASAANASILASTSSAAAASGSSGRNPSPNGPGGGSAEKDVIRRKRKSPGKK